MLLKKMGKKLAEGAKTELEFDPDRILNLVELGIGAGCLLLTMFVGPRCPKATTPTTIVINNIIQK